MQKLFKRSLAMVLALMMVVTMFAGSVSADEGVVDVQFRAMDEFKDVALVGVNSQLTTECVEGTGAIECVTTADNGDLMLHIYRNGQASNPANIAGAEYVVFDLWAEEANMFNNISGDAGVNVDTAANLNAWGDSAGKADAAQVKAALKDVKAGWNKIIIKLNAASTAADAADMRLYMVASGVAANKKFILDDVRFVEKSVVDSYTAVPGEVVFFDDFMPHHAADRGKWQQDTNNYTTGDFAYRALADFRSGDKLSNSRMWRDDPVDITGLYNENGEFYLTFDFYADPNYVGKAAHYNNDNELVETKDFGLENVRLHVLLYSKGDVNAAAGEPKQAKQAIEITRWERTNANATAENDWNMFGLENGLQPGWNRMAIKLTDKDGVLSYAKAGNEASWDPTKMWGINFSMRLASWQDKYDQHGTVETVFDNFKFMSVEAYEERVAAIDYNYQFRSCDDTGWQNTPRGEFYSDAATYTEGKGAIRTALDWRSGSKLMNAWLGSIDNRANNTDTIDVSKAIDKNGDFYVTFDLWADPEYTTEAKNYDETSGEVANVLDTGLNGGRFVVGLVTRGEGQTTTAMDNATISMEMIKAKGTDWSSFGLENGLQPGWNHIAIKCNANNLKSGGEAAWDPSKFWGVKFNYDNLNWKDPKEAHGTVEIRFDDLRIMSVAAYEADFARVSAAKAAIAAIAEMDKDNTESVAAATAVYNAVPANAKYLVSNYANLAKIGIPVNYSIYAVEGKNVGSGYILVPAGPQENTPYPTTPTPWTENFTEGTGAGKVQWAKNGAPTMHLSVLGIDQHWDFTDVEYVTFDLYVHGWSVKKTGDTDFNFGFGTNNDAASWGGQNKGWVGKDAVWEAGIKDLKEGWNHLVMPVPAGARVNGIGNMRLFFENSVVFNGEGGDAPYAIIDDIRAVDKKGLEIVKELDAAKDVVTAIQAMDTIEEMKAIRVAYDALNDVQKAYVFNLDVLENLEKDALAGLAIDDAYNALYTDVTVYHPTDAVDNSVVNINSGSWNVEAQDGAIKVIAKNDVTRNAFSVGFRADAVKLNDYDTMTFDMFIPEGVTVPEDTYGYAYFANKHTNNQDERVWRYEIKAQALAAEKGKWVTFTVPVADQAYEGIVQITIRLAVTTAKDGYVLIDNLQFNNVIETLTFANKADVDAVYAQYAALADSAKAYATCGAELVALKADLDAKQAALDDANAKIALIPALEDLELFDRYVIDAAKAAYEALAEDVKPFAVGADKIEPADKKVAEMFAAATDEQMGEFVSKVIVETLPSADVITLADAELIANVAATYDQYKAFATAEATAKMYALRAVVAALQADKDAADAVNATVAALPETLTLDNKDAVYAARDIYAQMNDNAKAQVADAAALAAAVAAMDKLVADDAAVKAITEAVNALAEDASKEEMKAVVDLYNAANAEVLAGLDKAVAAKAVAVKAEYVNMDAYEIQFRAFDTQKADYNCNMGGVFFGKDIPAVGTGYMGAKASGEQGELHHYIYAYNQNHNDADDGTNADGMVKFLVADAKDVYVSFDFYVSDASVINNASGDCGFGIDAESSDPDVNIGNFQAWGSTWTCRATTIKPLLKDIKTGWNHIVLPMSLVKNSAAELINGTEVTLRTMRFYMVGIKAPAGFVSAIDDVRVMNGKAAEAIFPARTNAKVVTDMIRAYPAEGATADDFYKVYLAYNKVADEYKDLIIGWDAFVEANAAFVEGAQAKLAADKAAADAVAAQIAALDRAIAPEDAEAIAAAKAAYEALTAEQKELVGNVNVLEAAIEVLPVAVVVAAINALPETVSDTDVSNTDIAAARAAYDALTDAQKALIAEEIVAKLTAAEANLVIAIDMAAAAEVEAMINALATPTDITVSDTDVVNAAAEAYGNLTAAQKAYLGEGVAEKLAACVAALDDALTVKLGDVDGNGTIDAKDALAVLKAAVGKLELTEKQAKAADANKDGNIDAKDALEILKNAVGKESALDK